MYYELSCKYDMGLSKLHRYCETADHCTKDGCFIYDLCAYLQNEVFPLEGLRFNIGQAKPFEWIETGTKDRIDKRGNVAIIPLKNDGMTRIIEIQPDGTWREISTGQNLQERKR